MKRIPAIVCLALGGIFVTGHQARAAAPVVVVPAAYALKFHVTSQVSSATNKAGDDVPFVMVEPLVVAGETIVERGALGHATLLVAGHAGKGGHEGDLTLRFDGVDATQGRHLVFDRQIIEVNGRNSKLAAAVLGFTPVVGLGARLIHGRDVTIAPDRVVTTVLLNPATARPLGEIFAAPRGP